MGVPDQSIPCFPHRGESNQRFDGQSGENVEHQVRRKGHILRACVYRFFCEELLGSKKSRDNGGRTAIPFLSVIYDVVSGHLKINKTEANEPRTLVILLFICK